MYFFYFDQIYIVSLASLWTKGSYSINVSSHSLSGTNVVKPFASMINECSQQAMVLVPGRHLQPSLMFMVKARSLFFSGASESCFSPVVSVRLGCKGIPVKNTKFY